MVSTFHIVAFHRQLVAHDEAIGEKSKWSSRRNVPVARSKSTGRGAPPGTAGQNALAVAASKAAMSR
jgi:hypothetical protein